MAVIRPFRGWRYDLAAAGAGDDLISPPYDIIDADMAARLRARSPYNAVHLELPEGSGDPAAAGSRYARAAQLGDRWRREGILRRDERPGLAIYSQEFVHAGGTRRRRIGLLAALQLEPYEEGVVLPHEATFPRHREDRFQLLCAARTQFSPIMALFPTAGTGVRTGLEAHTRGEPAFAARDDEGVEHALWVVNQPGALSEWASLLAPRQVFIADGHHRYETALRYQAAQDAVDTRGSHWFDHLLVYLVAMDDPGLALLPTHRVARGLAPATLGQWSAAAQADFEVTPVAGPVVPVPPGHLRLVVAPGDAAWDLALRGESPVRRAQPEATEAFAGLEATILHRHVFPNLFGGGPEMEVAYYRDEDEVWNRVRASEFQVGVFLPAPRVEQLQAVSMSGERMPQKTTYFWPKAAAGLVFYGEGSL